MPEALEWLDLSWAEMGGVVHDDVISVLLFLLVLTEGSTNFPRPFVPEISAYGTFQWCRYRKTWFSTKMACSSWKIIFFQNVCFFMSSYDIYHEKKLFPVVLHHFHVFDLHIAHIYYYILLYISRSGLYEDFFLNLAGTVFSQSILYI